MALLALSLEPEIEAQDIRSPLTDVSWHLPAAPRSGAGTAFILAAGNGIVTTGADDPVAIAAPSVSWLPSGQAVEVHLAAGARGVRLRVSGGILARVLPVVGARPDLQLVLSRQMIGVPADIDTVRRISQSAIEIGRELAEERLAGREACLAHLQLVAIQLLRLAAPEPVEAVASPQVLVQDFMRLVELNVRRHWRLGDYARELGVSPDRLVTAVERATGSTPSEIASHRLIEDARQLLGGSPLQVAEVALALGFRDPAYFNRFFSRRCGISPGRYRAQVASDRHAVRGSYAAWP